MPLLLALAALAAVGCGAEKPTDYQVELGQLDREIARLEGANRKVASEPPNAVAYPHLLYRRAALSGDYADFRAAETAIERALAGGGPADELHLLRAMLAFKVHRLERAQGDLDVLTRLAGHPTVEALRADLALQRGRYEEARSGYQRVVAASPTWDNLARVAYLASKTGDVGGAERLYRRAEDEITAKEMRSYAWVQLQRGTLDFDRGRYAEALAHYRRGDRAYSGHWLVEEHIAEVLDLLGHTGEAVAIYRQVVARTPMPELTAALAAIVERTDPAAGNVLRQEAERRFRVQYSLYPEAAAGHYVAYLIARRETHPDLVALAEANHRARPNAESKTLLARAYLRCGEARKAKALVAEVLLTPWRDPAIGRLAAQLGVPMRP